MPATHLLGAALAVLCYAAALYFLAATTSLYDDYVPGIRALRRGVWPSAFWLVPLAIAWASRSATWARTSVLISAGAVLSCGLLLALVLVHKAAPGTRVHADDRSLASTVRVALVHPSFSNRSTGTLVGGAVGAAIGLGLSMAQVRRCRRTAPASESR
ncbi:hypothetical protein [Ottowia oryzae]|uniref:Uncharacterized protein n=1 Tax=Ottowia oryzae TaxID=2109914 RepID=A0A2S0MEE9_9BURK|nr:hypothetical protein [Ottowia oryzae]AVO34248.1 hypothetical protein C6570_08400 [Ottowia oryzae]